MKRLFIAIKIIPGSELLRIYTSIQSLLAADKIRWVSPANIHLTLAFLGDTDNNKIKTLNAMLKERCSEFTQFHFYLTGVGIFKNIREPRVIWAGIRLSDRLLQLNNLINNGLKLNEFITEDRVFKPHLTLGRIKSVNNTENLKSVLENYRDVEFQKVEVKDVILFESILMQTGPIYKPLGKFYLKNF
jgi:2'-5' RNA ligase